MESFQDARKGHLRPGEPSWRITPAVAGEGLGRLRTSYGRVLERSEDRSEEHRTKCLHCPELWTSLVEVVA